MVVLVGAGIGVTPYASVLKAISMRAKAKASAGVSGPTIQKVFFYWICKDMAEFDSFKDLMLEVIDNSDLKETLEINTYTTGELDLKRVKLEKWNQFSGRPSWNRILKSTAEKYLKTEIGVFLCGPAPMARELQNACRECNANNSSMYKFHKENF